MGRFEIFNTVSRREFKPTILVPYLNGWLYQFRLATAIESKIVDSMDVNNRPMGRYVVERPLRWSPASLLYYENVLKYKGIPLFSYFQKISSRHGIIVHFPGRLVMQKSRQVFMEVYACK